MSSPNPSPSTEPSAAPARFGLAGRLAAFAVGSKLTPIAVIASILLGLFAVLQLPREEEPQIKVPMVDVIVAMPGATPAEVENRVTRPMEKLLWEIPDVEYLYSTSSPGQSMVIVRFLVGTDIEAANSTAAATALTYYANSASLETYLVPSVPSVPSNTHR